MWFFVCLFVLFLLFVCFLLSRFFLLSTSLRRKREESTKLNFAVSSSLLSPPKRHHIKIHVNEMFVSIFQINLRSTVFFVSPNLLHRTCNYLCSIFKTRIRKKNTLASNISHCQAFVVSRAFMAGAASQAGDADSSRAPGLTSGLQGSMDVNRGALLLVPQ